MTPFQSKFTGLVHATRTVEKLGMSAVKGQYCVRHEREAYTTSAAFLEARRCGRTVNAAGSVIDPNMTCTAIEIPVCKT